RGLELIAVGVLDAAGFDVKAEEKFAIGLLMPAEEIALALELVRPCGLELEAGALVHFVAEPFDALFLEHVLEAGVLAVGAVAEIAMNGEHSLGDIDEAL